MKLIEFKEKILKLGIDPKNQTEFIENVEIVLESPQHFSIKPEIICVGYNYNSKAYHVVITTYYSFFIIRYNFEDMDLEIIKLRKKDILKYETFTKDYRINFYYSVINSMSCDSISFKDKENYYLLLKWFVKNNNSYEN